MSTNLPSCDRAEYALTPSSSTDHCTGCQQPITAESYYRINGDIACEPCAQQATPAQIADSHAAFSRALFYGVGAPASIATSILQED
jgi:recombinational DNA repair protein (RecF pathway)